MRNKNIELQRSYKFIYGNEGVSFCLNTDQCDFTESSFCDSHHKHKIIWDLEITKSKKLKKLFNKWSKL